MSRKVKNIKDLSTGELIYVKGHAKSIYMSDGSTVEDAIIQAASTGSSVDPESLEGFIPMNRDFSDDFNNDFAR